MSAAKTAARTDATRHSGWSFRSVLVPHDMGRTSVYWAEHPVLSVIGNFRNYKKDYGSVKK